MALGLFAACACAFYAMLTQRPGMILDVDGLFHFKMARLIREHGPWVDISQLPFTVLGSKGPDHEWLFHLLLAPLTWLGSDLNALLLASAIAGAALAVFLYLLLQRAGAPCAALFALAAMFSGALLPARFITLRAQDIAVALMAASLFALARRSTTWIAVIAFLFTEAYHAAVILGVLLACTLAAQWIVERKVHTASITAIVLGVFAGLLASPWFPDNVRYLLFHTLFKTTDANAALSGIEWAPMPFARIAVESWPAHLILSSGLAALAVAARRAGTRILGVDTLACCALTIVFLAMYRFAWRFAEYYGPFAVISGALLWRDALPHLQWQLRLRGALAAGLAVLVACGAFIGAQLVDRSLTRPFDLFRDMMSYVDAHDEKPMVLNSLWSDFQPMYYWSERARFVAGLDGRYLLYGDPERFRVWNEISSGVAASRTDNARRIRQTFGAQWVVLPRGHEAMAAALARDPGARLALETRDGWLYRLESSQ